MADTPMNPPHIDAEHAPVIFFEGAPTFGAYNGVIHVTLNVALHRPGDDDAIAVDHAVAAYLRTNLVGAASLRDALNKALLIAAPTENDTKN